MGPLNPFSNLQAQREARRITGPQPTEEQGGRCSRKPQIFFQGIGWGQVGLVLSELKCRNSDPSEGGRALSSRGKADVAVC
eukprot:9408731-Alexandrium_andersonii.AAC.1